MPAMPTIALEQRTCRSNPGKGATRVLAHQHQYRKSTRPHDPPILLARADEVIE